MSIDSASDTFVDWGLLVGAGIMPLLGGIVSVHHWYRTRNKPGLSVRDTKILKALLIGGIVLALIGLGNLAMHILL